MIFAKPSELYNNCNGAVRWAQKILAFHFCEIIRDITMSHHLVRRHWPIPNAFHTLPALCFMFTECNITKPIHIFNRLCY
jgi:hypothetical protein